MTTLRFDFRFLETRYELYALRAHLDLVESNLPTLQEIEKSSAWDELRSSGLEDDEPEVSIMFNEVEERVERIYPRYFRGSFLLMLTAVLESGLEEVANYRARHCGNENLVLFEELNRRPRESFLDKMERYFEERLHVPLGLSNESMERLKRLYKIRNRLALGNGRASTPRHADQFEDWAELGIGISVAPGGSLDFTREFVEDTYRLVRECLERLMEDAKRDADGQRASLPPR